MHEMIIVGAGLAGLALAGTMTDRGGDVVVLEARTRIGGRVLTHATAAGAYDLGPAWIWPAMQPRVAHLARMAGAGLYPQSDLGAFIHQDHQGRTQRIAQGFRQEPPSMRVHGGIEALVAAVARKCRPGSIRLGFAVRRIAVTGDGVEVYAEHAGATVTLTGDRVALALPPRLLADIEITPELPPAMKAGLLAVPTWMAGHAKALALYDTAHWRDARLSGSAVSECGPLAEIHDAGIPGAAEAALVGFFGWDATRREAERASLTERVAAQLGVLYGAPAGSPKAVILRDWSAERWTATAADRRAPASHPAYGPMPLPDPWGRRLLLCGSEAAPEFGGYLEGALAAAEAAAAWAEDRRTWPARQTI
ncbi:MAG: FAD-dependent oxidoreductase [Gammaproteobacteria bacterium]|nr:FAD-dependent oxidoreductase [Gammaproteobacteria bacterium]